MVNDWKVKSSASRLELQQLLGILNLMSGCIISGRLFVSRMLSDFREAYKVEPKRVQLSQGFQMDLKWWQFALEKNNGVSILDHEKKTIRITMDGSTKGEEGGGLGLEPLTSRWMVTLTTKQLNNFSITAGLTANSDSTLPENSGGNSPSMILNGTRKTRILIK